MFIKSLLYAIKKWRAKIETDYNEEVMRLMQQKSSLSITPTMPYVPKYPSTREEAYKYFRKELQEFNEKTKEANTLSKMQKKTTLPKKKN